MSNPETYTLLLVDDHPMMRRGLRQLLDRLRLSGIPVTSVVASGGAARNPVVCQIIADATATPRVTRLRGAGDSVSAMVGDARGSSEGHGHGPGSGSRWEPRPGQTKAWTTGIKIMAAIANSNAPTISRRRRSARIPACLIIDSSSW